MDKIKTFHLYNIVIGGLSAKSFPTEKSANWNAVNTHDNHPAFDAIVDKDGVIVREALPLNDPARFVRVVEIEGTLTETQRKNWKPAFEDAWS
jgi:hypothetical protein